MAKKHLPSPAKEIERYEKHNNDVHDVRYQTFVSPIVNAVAQHYSTNSQGLDFGSGTGPVISKVLGDKGYALRQFDPFFFNDKSALNQQYDYIVCCEVIEHFHNPGKEFALLKNILKPNGHLYCMTHLYTKGINFGNWYYKLDDTHVFFYQSETLKRIAEMYNFSSLSIEGRLVTFQN